ncbi:unnamed protein product [Gongylonema pulchrum]|uniref:RGS domain-containing protein n=1 Tax=Gongylonema pulchrum TaxID=637853 RepID=A0A183EDM3_9BILA|nr:unnamed protein product [Gongylonema pulchrum]
MYCSRALNRCLKVGGRTEGPSKLETISILVIDFDGSTDIGACLSTLCVKCGLRPALLSGYALYVEDPVQPDRYLLLKNKQKLCDCISRWERELMDSKCGRVTEDVARIKLALRHRQYWSHLVLSETSAERTFLVHRMANEIVAGRIPVSSELGEELAAVFAQMKFGDLKTMTDEQFREIITSYYPAKLLDVGCERPIRFSALFSSIYLPITILLPTAISCSIAIIVVVVVDKRIFVRLNVETNWSELRGDLIRSIPYHRLVSFGAYHNDFMLTIERVLPPQAHPEETARERLTFSMPSKNIEQVGVGLTLLLIVL